MKAGLLGQLSAQCFNSCGSVMSNAPIFAGPQGSAGGRSGIAAANSPPGAGFLRGSQRRPRSCRYLGRSLPLPPLVPRLALLLSELALVVPGHELVSELELVPELVSVAVVLPLKALVLLLLLVVVVVVVPLLELESDGGGTWSSGGDRGGTGTGRRSGARAGSRGTVHIGTCTGTLR